MRRDTVEAGGMKRRDLIVVGVLALVLAVSLWINLNAEVFGK
jgi:hypothetical protein